MPSFFGRSSSSRRDDPDFVVSLDKDGGNEISSENPDGNPAFFKVDKLATGNNGSDKTLRGFFKPDAVFFPVTEVLIRVIVDF